MAKRIIDMNIGEEGFCVSWAAEGWDWLSYPKHLNGLNLEYSVHPKSGGTWTAEIERIENGWVIEEKEFTLPSLDKREVTDGGLTRGGGCGRRKCLFRKSSIP